MSLCRASSQLERLAISVHRSAALRSTASKARHRTTVSPDIRKWLTTTHTRFMSRSAPSTNHAGDRPRSPPIKLTMIHSRINEVLSSLPETPTDNPVLSSDEVMRILGSLAISARPQDLALIEKMLGQLTPLCGLRVDADVHSHILQGLMKNGNVQTVLNWLSQMQEKPGNIRPYLEHWHTFLNYCADTGQPKVIRHAMSQMAHTGRKPNNSTFRVFFRALFNSGATVGEFYSAFDRIDGYAFRYDPSLADMLFEGFMKLKEPEHATQVKGEFERRFSKRVVESTAEQVEWEGELENEVQTCGMASAITLCDELRREGYKITRHTLSVLLRSSCEVADLEQLEEVFQMKTGPTQWSILIGNTVRSNDLAGARSIYQQFKSRGLKPEAALVQPLVTALCDSAFQSDNDSFIDQALELNRDLSQAYPSSSPVNPTTPSSARPHSSGPDAYLYGTLLRAMANSVDVKKYSQLAVDLLADMEARGIEPDKRITTASLVVLGIRCSSSHDDALEAYRKVMGNEDPKNIGFKGYKWILHTMSRLSFQNKSAMPIWHYFEIVKDMRRAGLEIPPLVYASLLRRLAQLAEDASEEDTLRLAAAVRRVHDHLTLDPSITPDTILWNQLMDSYQRVGLFVEAYRVWEILLVSETYDNASVSIILDACGFANSWPLAEQVVKKLFERSFPFNVGNWSAYVECMCRNGMLNDAVKFVCMEMGKRKHKDVKPNAETVQVLLSFATRTNQQDEVAMRLQRYLPELWAGLPSDLNGFIIKPGRRRVVAHPEPYLEEV